MNRRDFLLGLSATWVMPAWGASAQIEQAYLANFLCPKCAEFDARYGSFEKRLGGVVHFVALGTSEKDLVTRAWYALHRVVPDAARLRKTLFAMVHQLYLNDPTLDELIELLRLEGVSLPPEDLRERIQSQATLRRMVKGAVLGEKSGLTYTPAFTLIRGQDVLKTIEHHDMTDAAFIQNCLDAIQEVKT